MLFVDFPIIICLMIIAIFAIPVLLIICLFIFSFGFTILSIFIYSDELIVKVKYDSKLSRYKLCNHNGSSMTNVQEDVMTSKENTHTFSDSNTISSRSIPKCALGHPIIYTISQFNNTDLKYCTTCNELLCESNELVYCYYCKECNYKICMSCVSVDSRIFTTKDIHAIFNGILSLTDVNITTPTPTINDTLIIMDKIKKDIENINNNNLKNEIVINEMNTKLLELLTLINKK
jgi:hypothetical protein